MVENVNKLFKSMINDIIKVFPEYTKRLISQYKEALNGNDDHNLKQFLENINNISDMIVDDDFSVFDNDPIILQNVSFKLIWISDITEETKSKIWKYLQTFCILLINEKSNDKINDVLKSIESKEKIKDKETLKDIKNLKKLNNSLENDKALDKLIEEKVNKENKGNKDIKNIDPLEDDKTNPNQMKEMEEMFKNTDIGRIAKDITEELNIEGMVENGGGIEDIFKSDNMSNIIQSISSKIGTQDLQDGNLISEATNICSSMQGNALFSSLMSNMGNTDILNDTLKNVKVKDKGKVGKSNKEMTIEKLD